MQSIGDIMSVYGKSNLAILKDIGYRIKQNRLHKNITQKELSELSGIHRVTISDIEKGKPFSMISFISILRALNELNNIELILPEPGINPLKLAKLKGKERKRASGNK